MKAARKLCLTHSAIRPTYNPGPLCQSPTPGRPLLSPTFSKKPSPSPLLWGVGDDHDRTAYPYSGSEIPPGNLEPQNFKVGMGPSSVINPHHRGIPPADTLTDGHGRLSRLL